MTTLTAQISRPPSGLNLYLDPATAHALGQAQKVPVMGLSPHLLVLLSGVNPSEDFIVFTFDLLFSAEDARTKNPRVLSFSGLDSANKLRANFDGPASRKMYKTLLPFGMTQGNLVIHDGGRFSVTLYRSDLQPSISRRRVKKPEPPALENRNPCGEQPLPSHGQLPASPQALVLLSVAGMEMTFEVPVGEAFDLGVQLTAKGYRKGV